MRNELAAEYRNTILDLVKPYMRLAQIIFVYTKQRQLCLGVAESHCLPLVFEMRNAARPRFFDPCWSSAALFFAVTAYNFAFWLFLRANSLTSQHKPNDTCQRKQDTPGIPSHSSNS
jgi:hypothetical protein